MDSSVGPEAARLPGPGHAGQADHEGPGGRQAADDHHHVSGVEAAAPGCAAQEPHLAGRHQGK